MQKYKQILVPIWNWMWTTFGSNPGELLLKQWGIIFLKDFNPLCLWETIREDSHFGEENVFMVD